MRTMRCSLLLFWCCVFFSSSFVHSLSSAAPGAGAANTYYNASQLFVNLTVTSLFDLEKQQFYPLRTPGECFLKTFNSSATEEDVTAWSQIFVVDHMFFTILLTVLPPSSIVPSAKNYSTMTLQDGDNVTSTIIANFNTNSTLLTSCLGLNETIFVAKMFPGSTNASIPHIFRQRPSPVYDAAMIVITGCSGLLIVVQTVFWLRFRNSSSYKRLEGHKRGANQRTWRQKLKAMLFP